MTLPWLPLLLVASQPAAPVVERYAIVVGVNESVDDGVAPLDFADNDAARYAALLEGSAARVELLSVLDPETQARFPAQANRARAPTKAALTRALADTFAAMRAAEREGKEADLLFVYAGHGAVADDGDGYVSLLDGRFSRLDLFAEVIEPSPARFNHIVIDACSAYHLLHRGAGDVRAVRSLLARASLKGHPNTGALLATSRDRATHEWSRIEGGVFSHQILSALAGAADTDLDGALGYAEVGAFVEAANEGVEDRRARVDVFVHPPRLLLERPLWQRSPAAPVLSLAADDTGHFTVYDARGVAIAELNKSREQPTRISLLGRAPFAVQREDTTWLVEAPVSDEVMLSSLSASEATAQQRSGLSDALERGLFTVPFGASYVRGYRSRLGRDLTDDERAPVASATPAANPLGTAAAISAGVAAGAVVVTAAAGAAYGFAALSLEQGRGSFDGKTAERYQAAGNGALAVGVAAGAAAVALGTVSVGLWLWPRE